MGRLQKPVVRTAKSHLSLHVGSVLLSLRKDRHITLQQVADGSGLGTGHISQIENGLSSPTADTLWKLATFFKVSAGVFFEGYSEGKQCEA